MTADQSISNVDILKIIKDNIDYFRFIFREYKEHKNQFGNRFDFDGKRYILKEKNPLHIDSQMNDLIINTTLLNSLFLKDKEKKTTIIHSNDTNVI